jgi:hypothetical protein
MLRVSVLERSSGMSRWNATVGGRFATVVPTADRIVLLSGNEPRIFDRAAGYDRESGEQDWSRNAPIGLVDGNRVAVLDQNDVVSLDVRTGAVRQRWQQVATDPNARTPLVVGDHAVVVSDQGVRVSAYGAQPADTRFAAGVGNPYLVVPSGNDQVTLVSQQGAAGVDVGDAQVRWARDVGARTVGRADGQLVLLASYGPAGDTVSVMNAATGREEAFRRFEGLPRRSLSGRGGYLADGAAYLVNKDGGIEAVALPSLDTLWTVDSAGVGGSARDVQATDVGLLVATDHDALTLLR